MPLFNSKQYGDGSVAFIDIQNISTSKLVGRATAGVGSLEEITLGTNLLFTGTTLNTTGVVTSVIGTANRITIAGTPAAPIVDISSGYVGQNTINTVGIISSGTWQGSTVNQAYLGSGGGGTTKFLREDNTWQPIAGADLTNYVTLNSVQTITGAKTFTNIFAIVTGSQPNGTIINRTNTFIPGYAAADVFTHTSAGVFSFRDVSGNNLLSSGTSDNYINIGYGLRTPNVLIGAPALTPSTVVLFNIANGTATLQQNLANGDFYFADLSTPYFTGTAGLINIRSLKTGSVAPTTTGTTQMVVSDINGLLSFSNILTGGATGDYVDRTTAQSIAGAKTFSNLLTTNNGINNNKTISGSVTPAYNSGIFSGTLYNSYIIAGALTTLNSHYGVSNSLIFQTGNASINTYKSAATASLLYINQATYNVISTQGLCSTLSEVVLNAATADVLSNIYIKTQLSGVSSIGTYTDILIETSDISGGTIGTHYAIDQQDVNAISRFAGVIRANSIGIGAMPLSTQKLYIYNPQITDATFKNVDINYNWGTGLNLTKNNNGNNYGGNAYGIKLAGLNVTENMYGIDNRISSQGGIAVAYYGEASGLYGTVEVFSGKVKQIALGTGQVASFIKGILEVGDASVTGYTVGINIINNTQATSVNAFTYGFKMDNPITGPNIYGLYVTGENNNYLSGKLNAAGEILAGANAKGIKLKVLSNYSGIWFDQATPDFTNYNFLYDYGIERTVLNGRLGIALRANNNYSNSTVLKSNSVLWVNYPEGAPETEYFNESLHVNGGYFGDLKYPVVLGFAMRAALNHTEDLIRIVTSTNASIFKLNSAGNLLIAGLASGLTAPVTTGSVQMVVTDVNGLLSFLPIPAGGGTGGTTYTGTAPIVVTGSVISVNNASATTSGVVNTVAQTFVGQKQFNNTVVIKSASGNGQTIETNGATFGNPSLTLNDLISGVTNVSAVITPRANDFIIGTVTPHPVIIVTGSQRELRLGIDGNVSVSKQNRLFNTTIPGTGADYGLHFSGANTNDYAKGITWDSPSTLDAQAGIYVQGNNTLGTKMFFATTDSYAAGAKTRMQIDNVGNLYINVLASGLTAPVTTGGLKMVVVDANGLFSNATIPSGGTGGTTYTGTSPIVVSGSIISVNIANTTTTGALTSTDWNTFNNKQVAGAYLTANQAITITATGDATGTSVASATAPSLPLVLATVNANVGSFTNANVTVNAKGLIVAASNGAVAGGVAGLNTQIQYNSAGAFAATSAFTYNGSNILQINGLSLSCNTASNLTMSFANNGVGGIMVDGIYTINNSGAGLKIGPVGTHADASSQLELVSTTKGFLQPRMTTVQRDAISLPATGLEVYNTTTNQPNYYNGTLWLTAVVPSIPNTAIAFGNASNILTSDVGKLTWANDYLTVGGSTAASVSGIFFNNGRAEINGQFNGMRMNVGSGTAIGTYDSSKSYIFMNRGNAFLTMSASATTGGFNTADFNALVKTAGYTVATLPAAGSLGRRAYVTDATAPTYLGTLTGGGTIKCPVFDNGTAWVSA